MGINKSIDTALRAIEENWIQVDILRAEKNEDLDEKQKAEQKSSFRGADRSQEIFEWCKKSCQAEWVMAGGRFYFKEDKDATMFSLRWA